MIELPPDYSTCPEHTIAFIQSEPACDVITIEDDNATASFNSVTDPEKSAFQPPGLANGSPEVAGLNSLVSTAPVAATMSNGTTSTTTPTASNTLPAGQHGQASNAGSMGTMEQDGGNQSAESRVDTPESVPPRAYSLERLSAGQPSPSMPTSHTVRCTAFTVMERSAADVSSNNSGPAYANHHGETGSQPKTPLKMPADPGDSDISLNILLQQTGMASSVNCRTVDDVSKCWSASVQGISTAATSTISSLPVDRPLPLTSTSESTHDERPRGNPEQAPSSRSSNISPAPSVNGSSSQCRGFSVAALANELSSSPHVEETRSGSALEAHAPGGGPVSKTKGGAPRRPHHPAPSESVSGGGGGARCAVGRSPTRVPGSKSQSPQSSLPPADGQQARDRGRTSNPFPPHLSGNSLRESSIIAQQLYQYNTNCHRDATRPVPRVQPVNPYFSQQAPGFPLPVSTQTGPLVASRSLDPTNAPPGYMATKPMGTSSDPQLLQQLMHSVDSDLAKHLASDTRFADQYAHTLSNLMKSSRVQAGSTREGQRPFNSSLSSVYMSGDGRVAQKQFPASTASSSSASVSLSANAPPSLGLAKRNTPDLAHYPQQTMATVVNRPRTTVHPTSNSSPSLPNNNTLNSRLNGTAGPSRLANGAPGVQHSQELISTAYCDRKLIDRVPPMLGQTEDSWLASTPHQQFPGLPASSVQPSTSRSKTLSPRATAAAHTPSESRDPPSEARGIPPPPYAWFQRPLPPGESVVSGVPVTATPTTSTTATTSLPMHRPPLSAPLPQQQPAPHAFSQNPMSCSPYAAAASSQSANELWEAYVRKLISENNVPGSYEALSSSLMANRLHQPVGNLQKPLSLHDKVAPTSKALPVHSLIQGLLGEHMPTSSVAGVQSQRPTFLHQQQQQPQPAHGVLTHPAASQVTGIAAGVGSPLENQEVSRRGQPLSLTTLHRPAHSDRVGRLPGTDSRSITHPPACGRWADAHIRVARFIHTVQRHHGAVYAETGDGAAFSRPLATSSSYRGSQPVRPIVHSALSLLWPNTLPDSTLAAQIGQPTPLPPPVAAQQQQHQRPPQEQAQSLAAHQQRVWASLPATTSSGAAVAPVLLPQGALDQGMTLLNQMFGGLLDQYLMSQTASPASVKDAVDMSLWRSTLNHLYQQSGLGQQHQAVRPSTSTYMLPGDANKQPQLPFFYPHRQPLDVSMATEAPMNLMPAEGNANNPMALPLIGGPTSKRRRMDVPGTANVAGDTLFNNLLLQQQQIRDPRLAATRPAGASPGVPGMPKMTNPSGGFLNGFHLPGVFQHLRPQAVVGAPLTADGSTAQHSSSLPLPAAIESQLSAMAAAVRNASAAQHAIPDGGGGGANGPQTVPPHLHSQQQLGVIPPR